MSSNNVSVPAHVLQDLIFNAELASAGQGDMETTIARQAAILQSHIEQQVGDVDTVYGREPTTVDADTLLAELFGDDEQPAITVETLSWDDPKVVNLFERRA